MPTSNGHEEGDTTRKHRLMIEEELSPLAKSVKGIKFWVAIAGALLAAGFAASTYVNQYAKAADVAEVKAAHQEHVREEAEKVGALRATVEAIHDDQHWQRRQIEKIADRVGAARVPDPREKRDRP